MRIVSGNTTSYLYFVAVDATDFTTRETGLSSFTVYRSRNGGTAAAMTTPTINETDTTNMPGVYELLLDEDTTIDSGFDSQEMAFHITHAGMAPVTRTVEIYRPKITAGATLSTATVATIASDLLQVYSDTTIIASDVVQVYSDTTVIASDVAISSSKAVQIYSDTAIIYSDTTAIHSDTTIIASDVVIIGSDLLQVYSDTTIIASDLVLVYSDTTAIESGIAPIVSGTADSGTTTTMVDAARTEADTDYWRGKIIKFTSGTISGQCRLITGFTPATDTITFTPATTQAVSTNTYEILPFAGVADVYSDTTTIASDLVLVYSDTTAIHSDTTIVASDVVQIYSDTTITSSKAVQIYSDTTVVASDLVIVASDLLQVYSDTTIIASDLVIVASDLLQVYSDTTIIASDLVQVYSDTTKIASDVALLDGAGSLPGQEAPSATASPLTQISYLYKAWRNKSTQTSSQYTLYADDTTTVDQKASVSDNGTVFSRDEIGTGP